MWNDLTPRAKQVLAFAFKEARLLRHERVDADHLLFGMIRHGGGIAITILRGAGLDLESVDAELKEALGLGNRSETEENLPATRELKSVITRARSLAREQGHKYIGTTHLFLGLLGETNAKAVLILKKHGVEMDWVRREILEEHEQGDPQSPGKRVWLDRLRSLFFRR